MSVFKIHYFLFLAVFMLAAKPFVGFHAVKNLGNKRTPTICVKAFTKRKQEYVENSDLDISVVQKKLANPLLALTLLFSFFLNTLFPAILRQVKNLTSGILSDIHLRLFAPVDRCLLSGKLLI